MFMCCTVVGAQEVEKGTANVRTRDNKVHGEHAVTSIIDRFRVLSDTYCRNAEEVFDENAPAEGQAQQAEGSNME